MKIYLSNPDIAPFIDLLKNNDIKFTQRPESVFKPR